MADEAKKTAAETKAASTPEIDKAGLPADAATIASIRNLELFRSGLASLGWAVRGVASKFGGQYPSLMTNLRVFYLVLQIGHRAIGEVEESINTGEALKIPDFKTPELPKWDEDGLKDISILNVAFETLRPWVVKFEESLPGHSPATKAFKHWMALLLTEWDMLEAEFSRAINGTVPAPAKPVPLRAPEASASDSVVPKGAGGVNSRAADVSSVSGASN